MAGSATAYAGLSRARTLVSGLPSAAAVAPSAADGAGSRTIRNIIIPAVSSGASMRPAQPRRARGIGSRFASRATPQKEFMR